jgi:hypothetical protein
MDPGPGFWNSTVPLAIPPLSSFKFGRAKSPKDKASMESEFGGIGEDVMRCLHGFNGAGPGKQPGYDGRAMAVLSMAQIEQILWWYFTDCVPFKSSQRRGSLGAVNHVAFARTLKRFGLLPPLARRDVRRALGLRVTRTVTTMGIEVFRMPFQGQPDFRAWSIDNIGEKVTVYIDPHRIEEVTVVTGDGKSFYLKAGLSQFRHFSLQDEAFPGRMAAHRPGERRNQRDGALQILLEGVRPHGGLARIPRQGTQGHPAGRGSECL